jgi:uncharacterized protein
MSIASDASGHQPTKYQDLLSKAVFRLPDTEPNLRLELYDRARAALSKHLRALDPPLSEMCIAQEEHALNRAIEFVEARARRSGTADQAALDPAKNWLSDLLRRASRDEGSRRPEAAQPNAPAVEEGVAVTLAALPSKPRQPFVPRLVSERAAGAEETPFTPASFSKIENPNETLRKLQRLPGLEASALISADGTLIASALSPGVEAECIARMAATLRQMGASAAAALGRGNSREIVIHGKDGYAVLMSAGSTFLLALANDSGSLGPMFSNMYEALRSLDVAARSEAIAERAKA